MRQSDFPDYHMFAAALGSAGSFARKRRYRFAEQPPVDPEKVKQEAIRKHRTKQSGVA